MLKYNYKKRLSVEEIKADPWFNGETATPEEVQEELQKRRKMIDERLCEEDFSTDAETVGSMNDFYDETVKRSAGVDWDSEAKPRKIKVYDPSNRLNTEFFSTFPPTALLGAVFTYIEDKKIKIDLNSRSYKANIQTLTESGNEITFTV